MAEGHVHLIKLCVGIDDVAHLRAVQAARLKRHGEVVHVTRQHPKRTAELSAGGSLYWVIRGAVRARQRILDLRTVDDEEGRKKCAIVLDPDLVETEALPFRAFQGWRYLDAERAPPDTRDGAGDDALPAGLAAELRGLGLL
jgi:hypothetical protein